ncbi:glycosyltransferase [Sulfitobacter aestuarii]|uniref:Glycosyltransferase n=1 Tax=Sulfitobacter aestuarii TaxID=2161676 RepID=A0ABW5U709_9RHOB
MADIPDTAITEQLVELLHHPLMDPQGAPDLEVQLRSCLQMLNAAPASASGSAGMERLFGLLLSRLRQDKVRQLGQLQKAQFTAQHYRSQAMPRHPSLGWKRRIQEIFAARHAVPPLSLADLAASDAPCFSDELPSAFRDALLERACASVSVIMPSWNRAHVISQAVGSALLQSLAAREVIVIDDGSADGTVALLQEKFADAIEQDRLVILSQPRAGVSHARNAGLERARGDVIAYLDSDNTWEPDHLLVACAALQMSGSEGCAYTALCRHNLSAGWSDILYSRYDRLALEQENYVDLNSFVHHRGLYERYGGFDPELTRLVDWDLILRYTAQRAPATLPVLTGHYFIEESMLQNITLTEAAEPNIARIRQKLAVAGA